MGIKILLRIPRGLITGRGGHVIPPIFHPKQGRDEKAVLDVTASFKAIQGNTPQFSHFHKILAHQSCSVRSFLTNIYILLISLGANVSWERAEERFAKKVVLTVVTLR